MERSRVALGAFAWFGRGSVAATAVCAFSGLCHAAGDDTFIWTGQQDNFWSTAQNWQPVQVPGVDVTGANAKVLTSNGLVDVNVWLTLGELETKVPVRFWNTQVTVGTAEVSGLILQNATFNFGQVDFHGTTQWNWGVLLGGFDAPARNHGTMILPTGLSTGTKQITAARLTNFGTVQQSSAIQLTSDGNIRNEGTWQFLSNNSNITYPSLVNGSFHNLGTIQRLSFNGGVGGSEFRAPFVNDGMVSADTGEVHFIGDGTHRGGYQVSNGGLIRFAPNGNQIDMENAQFSGAGEVWIASGPFHLKENATLAASVHPFGAKRGLYISHSGVEPVVFDGNIHNTGTMRWGGGPLQGSGEIDNEGAMLIAGGTVLRMRLNNLEGGYVWQNVGFQLGNGVVVSNREGATWEINNGNITKEIFASGVTFSNNGIVRRIGTAPTAAIDVPLMLFDGTVEVVSGTLRLSDGGEFVGNGFLKAPSDEVELILEEGLYRVTGLPRVEGPTGRSSAVRMTGTAELHMDGGAFIVGEGGFFVIDAGLVTSNGPTGGVLFNQGALLLMNNTSIGGPVNPHGTVRNQESMASSGVVNVYGRIENEPNGTAFNSGTIRLRNGSVENRGWWTLGADVDAGAGQSGTWSNLGNAVLIVTSGHKTIWQHATLDNQATVEVYLGSLTVQKCSQVANGELTGGTWVVRPGATLNLPQGITKVGSPTRIDLDGGSVPGLAPNSIGHDSGVSIGGAYNFPELTNSGELEIKPGGSLNINGSCTNEGGSIKLSGECDLNIQGELFNDEDDKGILGEITEVLVISLNAGVPSESLITATALHNAGVIRPGGAGAAGPFNFKGTFNQLASGRLHVELGGSTPMLEHDRVRVIDGDANLAGTLMIDFLDEFSPQVNQQFEILVLGASAASGRGATGGFEVTGAFDSVQGPSGANFSLAYSSDRVVLTFAGWVTIGDLNGDGVVNISDLLLLFHAWGPCTGACPADLNGDQFVDVSDLLLLFANWG